LKIVRSGIEDQLDGSVVCDWEPEGLSCTMSIPAIHVVRVMPDHIHVVAPPVKQTNGHSLGGLVGKKILVVEDEFLISMSVEEILSDLGMRVVGPVGNLVDGFAAMRAGGLDGAILDLNLRGEQTYPLAEALTAQGVPIVFITGYDSETVDTRYTHVPLLQKPIEFDSLKRVLVTNLDKQQVA